LEFETLAKTANTKGLLSDAALKNIQSWAGDAYRRTHLELNGQFRTAGEDKKKWQDIDNAWYTILAPGTAGMRGSRGLGTNRISEYTIGLFMVAHAQAVASAEYNGILEAHDSMFDGDTTKKAVVLGGDSRHGSYDPATKGPGPQLKLQALINVILGTKAYVYKMPVSTPQLSWSTHELEVDAGVRIVSGAMNTASHNPSSDNGVKPYKPDGSQSTGVFAKLIQEKASRVSAADLDGLNYQGLSILDNLDAAYERALRNRDIVLIGGQNDPYLADEKFIEKELEEAIHVVGELFNSQKIDLTTAKIVISPLFGVSRHILEQILKRRGLRDDQIVWVQDEPNPDFPGVKNGKPNPETPDAREVALQKAVEVNADLILWTDPDADRPAVASKINPAQPAANVNDYVSFNGNQQLALVMDYLVREIKDFAQATQDVSARSSGYEQKAKLIWDNLTRVFAASTAVSGDLMKVIARANGINVVETLTGFKYIGDQVEIRSKAIQMKLGLTERKWQALSKAKKIELALKNSDLFIFGGEESLGALTSDGPHDKDAIAGVMWFVEILGRLNQQGTTLKDRLDEIYKQYGYFVEGFPMLTKGKVYGGVSFSEGEAMKIIKSAEGPSILNYFRNSATSPRTIGGKKVIAVLDYDAQKAMTPDGEFLFDVDSQAGLITPLTPNIPELFSLQLANIPVPSAISEAVKNNLQGLYSFAHASLIAGSPSEKLPRENFLMLVLEDGSKVVARPSGTEPVIKFYINARGLFKNKVSVDQWITDAAADLSRIADDVARQVFPARFITAKSEVRRPAEQADRILALSTAKSEVRRPAQQADRILALSTAKSEVRSQVTVPIGPDGLHYDDKLKIRVTSVRNGEAHLIFEYMGSEASRVEGQFHGQVVSDVLQDQLGRSFKILSMIDTGAKKSVTLELVPSEVQAEVAPASVAPSPSAVPAATELSFADQSVIVLTAYLQEPGEKKWLLGLTDLFMEDEAFRENLGALLDGLEQKDATIQGLFPMDKAALESEAAMNAIAKLKSFFAMALLLKDYFHETNGPAALTKLEKIKSYFSEKGFYDAVEDLAAGLQTQQDAIVRLFVNKGHPGEYYKFGAGRGRLNLLVQALSTAKSEVRRPAQKDGRILALNFVKSEVRRPAQKDGRILALNSVKSEVRRRASFDRQSSSSYIDQMKHESAGAGSFSENQRFVAHQTAGFYRAPSTIVAEQGISWEEAALAVFRVIAEEEGIVLDEKRVLPVLKAAREALGEFAPLLNTTDESFRLADIVSSDQLHQSELVYALAVHVLARPGDQIRLYATGPGSAQSVKQAAERLNSVLKKVGAPEGYASSRVTFINVDALGWDDAQLQRKIRRELGSKQSGLRGALLSARLEFLNAVMGSGIFGLQRQVKNANAARLVSPAMLADSLDEHTVHQIEAWLTSKGMSQRLAERFTAMIAAVRALAQAA